jgi:RNA polymerase sigma factor (sigma-70 family)
MSQQAQTLDDLIRENRGLVYYVSKRIRRTYPQVKKEDLESQLFESLFLAAKKFDPNRGIKFSTYAVRVMLNEGRRWAKAEVNYQQMERASLNEALSRLEIQEDSPNPKLKVALSYAFTGIKTKKQREIVEAFLANPTLSYKRIASDVGVSTSYARTVLRQFKKRART